MNCDDLVKSQNAAAIIVARGIILHWLIDAVGSKLAGNRLGQTTSRRQLRATNTKSGAMRPLSVAA